MAMQGASTGIEAQVASIVDDMKSMKGPLLPILHRVQEELGHVPQEVLPVIASGLNLSRAEVYGVVSFYHDYRSEHAGRHVLKLCQAESCQAMGSDDVAARLKQALGIDFHQTTPDGRVTLEPVYCLGLCACSPAALLDGEAIGRIDAARVDEIVAEVRS